MQKFCPNLEAKRSIWDEHFSSPKSQEHKMTRVARIALELTEGMVLITHFHVYKNEGIDTGSNPRPSEQWSSISPTALKPLQTTVPDNSFYLIIKHISD